MIGSTFHFDWRACLDLLAARLDEPAPSRIQLLAGPRQVGKTTLLLALAERAGESAIYAAADGPEASLPGFWDRLWSRAADTARAHGRAVVLLDEAHVLGGWATHLKAEWDRWRRRKMPINIVATGSSALHLGAGARTSLTGRFERVTLTHWSASSLISEFGMTAREAADAVVRQGAYPGAFSLRDDPPRWSAYVRDAIVEPAIGRDIFALASVRKPALLRQVFVIAASSPAQVLSLQKIQGRIHDQGALETIAHYLALLEEAFLVAALDKHSTRATRSRSAPPKLVTLSNALLAAADPAGSPDATSDPARYGAWVENACLAHAWNAGQRVRYWREEPLEVDAVLDGSWGAWAVEVKTGQVAATDLRGLAEFTRRHPAYKPLVLCDERGEAAVRRFGIAAMSWRTFLLGGPAPSP